MESFINPAWFTIFVIFALFFAIYKELLRPALGFLLAVMVFIISGVLTPDEVLNGFSNKSIACIILLILLSGALRKNFNLEAFLDKVFDRENGNKDIKKRTGYRRFISRMMIIVAGMSSIINNTPVVAMMTPYVFNWGKKYGISPGKLLIPLSYSAIMGGMLTLIGTSTTLVLNGFLSNQNQGDLPDYHLLFIGGTVCTTGILFLSTIGGKLLPNRKDILENFRQNQREYTVEANLTDNSPLIGLTLMEAGLRNLKGVFLVEIVRQNKVISPVKPDEIIQKNDSLIFAGNTDDIVELVKSGLGIKLPQEVNPEGNPHVNVVEAVISNNSSVIGQTVKEIKFRNRYDAAIVGIHRNGERVSGKIGDIKLTQGDLLLLYAGPDFNNRVDLYRDIYVVSKITEIVKHSRRKTVPLVIVALSAIVLLAIGYFSLFTSLLIIFSLMAGMRMISVQDIKRELDFNMIVILVFSLAIGEAMMKTGAGDMVASWLLGSLESYGKIAVLGGLLVLTTILTSFITNVGAVSVAFPLAYSLSNSLEMSGMPFYLAIAYAASAAFLTPIGYQTNLIIYGPGGYSFKDFIKIGLPVTLIYLVTVMLAILYLYQNTLLP